MDFMSRGGGQAPHTQKAESHTQAGSGSSFSRMGSGMRYAFVILLFSVTVLLAGVAIFLGTSSSGKYAENALLEKDRYQAVFLNGGQVYFGKVNGLNNRFMVLEDIYYLRVNQQVQPNQSTNTNQNTDISLAKLGNELHGPQDRMVINRDQVMFWENLKDDGQVVKAISDYKANGGASSNQQQGSSNTNTTPTPTPTPGTGAGTNNSNN